MKRMVACVVLIASFLTVVFLHHHILEDPPDNRVEIVGVDEQAFPDILRGANPVWENDRMVFHSPTLFTAQQAQTALVQSGIDKSQFEVLDYSWAAALVNQSKTLWMVIGAVLLLFLLIRLAHQQIKLEIGRAKAALTTQYSNNYLNDASIRILSKAIMFVLELFLGIVIIRFLMAWEVALPSTLLPQDSLFHLAYYRQWCASTFPAEALSEYGTVLLHQLKVGYCLSGVECLLLMLLACTAENGLKKLGNGG